MTLWTLFFLLSLERDCNFRQGPVPNTDLLLGPTLTLSREEPQTVHRLSEKTRPLRFFPIPGETSLSSLVV